MTSLMLYIEPAIVIAAVIYAAWTSRRSKKDVEAMKRAAGFVRAADAGKILFGSYDKSATILASHVPTGSAGVFSNGFLVDENALELCDRVGAVQAGRAIRAVIETGQAQSYVSDWTDPITGIRLVTETQHAPNDVGGAEFVSQLVTHWKEAVEAETRRAETAETKNAVLMRQASVEAVALAERAARDLHHVPA